MKKNKKIIIPLVLMLIIGGTLITNNGMKNIRAVDILHLIALGAVLGVLFVNLISNFRKQSD